MSTIKVTLQNNLFCYEGVLTFDTTLKALTETLKNFPKEGVVELDLKNVSKSDSSGLALLTNLLSKAKEKNLHLRIKNTPKKMRDLARVSGLDELLPFSN
ncbi:MAG TPA: STAS domain-containing protein [Gammaproteobacteria bacterium]|nr:STAS domain-containing protein [Gammaproteobacteria bacterium]